MHQDVNNIYIKWPRLGRKRSGQNSKWRRAAFLFVLTASSVSAQEQSPVPIKEIVAGTSKATPAGQPVPSRQTRTITLSDAVSIFLQQNLQLVAARYDIDTADAEKLTAKLRPNPQISFTAADIPLDFHRLFINPQTFDYGVSQTIELGGKRQKRIDATNADADVARAQFETTVWQLTNDLKRKFYTVLLAQALLNLSKENQRTFEETVTHTREVFQLGEISGLDLQRLEIEKFKFDTDLANSQRDYEVALRDLRVSLGGDYRAMNIEAAGAIDYYQPHDFSLADLRSKALTARPDLKVARLSERSADAAIRLQDAQKVPDITVGAGIEQVAIGGSTYNVGVSLPIPVTDRNQGERAKAHIQKMKAQNDQAAITNQIQGDVDKALAAYEIQKKRVELYRTGILTKVTDIQTLTEVSLKAGESSTLDLLDAIRTRRDTLAGFYQTIFDYQMSLLDLELATATPLP